MQNHFDAVVIVDWSAAGQRTSARNQKDSVWIGWRTAHNHDEHHFRTRAEGETFIVDFLAASRQNRQRILAGFDFAFGYPQGFAERLTGEACAKSVWAWLAGHITDTPLNVNNRFVIANQINQEFARPGPFWSHPASHRYSKLFAKKTGIDYPALGLQEYRQVERIAKGAKSAWMLCNPGSVGSQSLMGLPMIHRLSQTKDTAVWPFDRHEGASVVLAEVYPSLLSIKVATEMAADPGLVKDRAQVRLLARALFNLSQAGRLAPLFVTPAPPVSTEEGWILGAGHQAALEDALA